MDALIWLTGKMSLLLFSTSSINSPGGPVKNPRSQPILFQACVNLERALWFLVKILTGATTLSDLFSSKHIFLTVSPSALSLSPGPTRGFFLQRGVQGEITVFDTIGCKVRNDRDVSLRKNKLSSVCLPSEAWLSALGDEVIHTRGACEV